MSYVLPLCSGDPPGVFSVVSVERVVSIPVFAFFDLSSSRPFFLSITCPSRAVINLGKERLLSLNEEKLGFLEKVPGQRPLTATTEDLRLCGESSRVAPSVCVFFSPCYKYTLLTYTVFHNDPPSKKPRSACEGEAKTTIKQENTPKNVPQRTNTDKHNGCSCNGDGSGD